MVTHEHVFILDVLQHQELQGKKINEETSVRMEEKVRTGLKMDHLKLSRV